MNYFLVDDSSNFFLFITFYVINYDTFFVQYFIELNFRFSPKTVLRRKKNIVLFFYGFTYLLTILFTQFILHDDDRCKMYLSPLLSTFLGVFCLVYFTSFCFLFLVLGRYQYIFTSIRVNITIISENINTAVITDVSITEIPYCSFIFTRKVLLFLNVSRCYICCFNVHL